MLDRAKNRPKVLGNWKEIAAYLGKGVRTVQRWEQQLGLPVRRPGGRSLGIVCASPEELDMWLETRWSKQIQNDPPEARPAYVSVSASVSTSHELITEQRRLRADVHRAASTLVEQCRMLTLMVKSSDQRPSEPTNRRVQGT